MPSSQISQVRANQLHPAISACATNVYKPFIMTAALTNVPPKNNTLLKPTSFCFGLWLFLRELTLVK
jgi:hypothetical protein